METQIKTNLARLKELEAVDIFSLSHAERTELLNLRFLVIEQQECAWFNGRIQTFNLY